MELTLEPSPLFGAVGQQAVDFGIGVVEQDALAAGALPDLNFPDDSPIRGWVFRKRIMLQDHTTVGVVPSMHRFELDLKSKRLIGDSELVLIIDNNSARGTAFSVETEGLIRCLYLMP